MSENKMELCGQCKNTEIFGRNFLCDKCKRENRKNTNRKYEESRKGTSINKNEKRYCQKCKEVEIGSNRKIKYCSDCKLIARKESEKKTNDKWNKVKNRESREKTMKLLNDNFTTLNLSGLDLIPQNFNEKSPIGNRSYTRHFATDWANVLRYYGVYESFFDAIKIEFKKYVELTGSTDLIKFGRILKVDSSYFFNSMNLDEIRSYAGVEKRPQKYSKENLRENFIVIKDKIGRAPYTVKEFEEYTSISFTTYVNILALNRKEMSQIEILVKFYSGEKDFIKYQKNRKEYILDKVGSPEGVYMYSDEEMFERVKEFIDDFVKRNNTLPTCAYVEANANISISNFRRRFSMNYFDMLEYLGYEPIDIRTETMVVNIFEKLLGEKSIRQAAFDWLKSDKGVSLRCDAYFPSYNLVIEYDGRQHFYPVDFAGKGEEWAKKEFERTIFLDNIKNTEILKNNIDLLRIAYDEPYWDEDFLRIRLYENGIIPFDRSLINGLSSSNKIA